LGATVLEYCDVGRRDAHPIGELPDAHLLSTEFHINATDDGHRTDNRIHLDLERGRSDEYASEDDDQQDDSETDHQTEQLGQDDPRSRNTLDRLPCAGDQSDAPSGTEG